MSVLGKSFKLKHKWNQYADAIIEKAIRNRMAELSLNSLLLGGNSVATLQDAIDALAAEHEAMRNPHWTRPEDINVYSSEEEIARAQAYLKSTAIPLDRFGDLNFLPIAATGNYEGSTTFMGCRTCVLHLEKDNTMVMIRNSTDGKSIGAYYSFIRNAVSVGNIPDTVKMVHKYRPSFLTSVEEVAYMYNAGDGGMLAGRIQSTGGILRDIWFITKKEDTLDGSKHTWNLRFTPSTASALSLPYNNMHDIMLNSEWLLIGDRIVLLTYHRHRVFMRYINTQINNNFAVPSVTNYIRPGGPSANTAVPTSLGNGQVGVFTTDVTHSFTGQTATLMYANRQLETQGNDGVVFDPETNQGTRSYSTIVRHADGSSTIYLNLYAQVYVYWIEQEPPVEGEPVVQLGSRQVRAGINWHSYINIGSGNTPTVAAYVDGNKPSISVTQNSATNAITITGTNARVGDYAWPFTVSNKIAGHFSIATKLLNSGRYIVFSSGMGNAPDVGMFIERNIFRDTTPQQNLYKGSNFTSARISHSRSTLVPEYGSILVGNMRIVGLSPTGIILTQLRSTAFQYASVTMSNLTDTVNVPSITYGPGYSGFNMFNAQRSNIGGNGFIGCISHVGPGNSRKMYCSSFLEGVKTSGSTRILSVASGSGTSSMTSGALQQLGEAVVESFNLHSAEVLLSDRIADQAYTKTFVFIPQIADLPAFAVVGVTTGRKAPIIEDPENPENNYIPGDWEMIPGTEAAQWIYATFDPTAKEGSGIELIPSTVTIIGFSQQAGNLSPRSNTGTRADFESLTSADIARRLTGIWIYETPAGYFIGGSAPVVHKASVGNGYAASFLFFWEKDTRLLHQNKFFSQTEAQGQSDNLIMLPNRGIGAQTLNQNINDSGTKVLAGFYITEPNQIPTNNLRLDQVPQDDWIAPISIQPQQGFYLYITQSVQCFMRGVTYTLPARTFSFGANMADRTLAFFVELSGNSMQYTYEVATPDTTENLNKMFIGTVVLGISQIISINLRKTTRFGGVAISATPRGNAIPVSLGSPTEHAYLAWS